MNDAHPTDGDPALSPDAAAGESPLACDVLVVGGGINGVGIARDLAGRGWTVMLCEQDDLGAHASSQGTKLLGGLQGLVDRHFIALRRSLQERERLMAAAPHITRPVRFMLPHDPATGGTWRLQLGLFVYDHLTVREWLPGSSLVDLTDDPAGALLKRAYSQAFAYSDGWVDDARLVVLCALDAQARGAAILPRTRCLRAERHGECWRVELERRDRTRVRVVARALVNATGAWAEHFLAHDVSTPDGLPLQRRRVPLLRGAHIVVPRLAERDLAFVLPTADSRLVHVLPLDARHTLIGAVESEWSEATVECLKVQPGEEAWLCEQASRHLRRAISPQDVVGRFCALRHRLDVLGPDARGAWREHLIETDRHAAPLLTVWGGPVSTFRRVAEEAADELGGLLGDSRPAWTRDAHLPGGDFSEWLGPAGRPDEDFERFIAEVRRRWRWLDLPLARRWARQFGSLIESMLAGVRSPEDLGREIAPGVFEAELRYLRLREWALTADDVLWRRTKLGLALDAAGREAVAAWFRHHDLPGPALGTLSSRDIRRSGRDEPVDDSREAAARAQRQAQSRA